VPRAEREILPGPRGGRRRYGLIARNSALAVVSALVLSTTWYAWSTLQSVSSGLTTADVIDPAAKSTTGPQNILLVGIDSRTDAQGNPLPAAQLAALHAGSSADGADATDTMILLHIPAGGGRAIGFSIPRDSYVQLAGGYGMHKINSAYTYAEVTAYNQLTRQGVTGPQRSVQAAQAGAKNSIATIEAFTGLQINHFASVNLVGFYDISQAVGGVPVCLKAPVHDSYSGANFPAGFQTIQGAQALAFVRQRHGLALSDLDRIKRQQVFMASMAHTVLSAGVLADPTKLNSLIDAVKKAVTLDQGWDILGFAQQMQGMTAGGIQFQTVPIVNITYPTPSDGDAIEVDPAQVKQFISSQIAAVDNPQTATQPAAGKSPAPAAPAPNNSTITTEVYNSTGVAGLASEVLKSLTSQGFTAGSTGNGTTRTSTVIDYPPGGQANAQRVAQALGGNITTVANSALSSGTVRVYLGTTYSGPKGAVASTGAGAGSSGSAAAATSTAAAPPAITSGGVTCIN
jgi:LCP family protein required for cell wall assembly